jgi:hypothetical protein
VRKREPLIAEEQEREFTQSSATRQAVGKLVPWLIATSNRLAGGNKAIANKLFEHARRTMDDLDVTRFGEDSALLRKLLVKAMREFDSAKSPPSG